MRRAVAGAVARRAVAGRAKLTWDPPAAGPTPTSYELWWGPATGNHPNGPLVDAGSDRVEFLSSLAPTPGASVFVVARARNGSTLGPKSNEIEVRDSKQVGP